MYREYNNQQSQPFMYNLRTTKKCAECLFVGDLSSICTELDLYRAFSQYGLVENVLIHRNKPSNVSLGYGFVKMRNAAEAFRAREMLSGTLLCGRKLRVQISDDKDAADDVNNQFQRKYSLHFKFESIAFGYVASEEKIRSVLSVYGDVLDVSIRKHFIDKMTRLQRGYGFVEMPDTVEGIQSSITVLTQVPQLLIDNVVYSLEPSHDLRCKIQLALNVSLQNDNSNNSSSGSTTISSGASTAASRVAPASSDAAGAIPALHLLPPNTGPLLQQQQQQDGMIGASNNDSSAVSSVHNYYSSNALAGYGSLSDADTAAILSDINSTAALQAILTRNIHQHSAAASASSFSLPKKQDPSRANSNNSTMYSQVTCATTTTSSADIPIVGGSSTLNSSRNSIDESVGGGAEESQPPSGAGVAGGFASMVKSIMGGYDDTDDAAQDNQRSDDLYDIKTVTVARTRAWQASRAAAAAADKSTSKAEGSDNSADSMETKSATNSISSSSGNNDSRRSSSLGSAASVSIDVWSKNSGAGSSEQHNEEGSSTGADRFSAGISSSDPVPAAASAQQDQTPAQVQQLITQLTQQLVQLQQTAVGSDPATMAAVNQQQQQLIALLMQQQQLQQSAAAPTTAQQQQQHPMPQNISIVELAKLIVNNNPTSGGGLGSSNNSTVPTTPKTTPAPSTAASTPTMASSSTSALLASYQHQQRLSGMPLPLPHPFQASVPGHSYARPPTGGFKSASTPTGAGLAAAQGSNSSYSNYLSNPNRHSNVIMSRAPQHAQVSTSSTGPLYGSTGSNRHSHYAAPPLPMQHPKIVNTTIGDVSYTTTRTAGGSLPIPPPLVIPGNKSPSVDRFLTPSQKASPMYLPPASVQYRQTAAVPPQLHGHSQSYSAVSTGVAGFPVANTAGVGLDSAYLIRTRSTDVYGTGVGAAEQQMQQHQRQQQQLLLMQQQQQLNSLSQLHATGMPLYGDDGSGLALFQQSSRAGYNNTTEAATSVTPSAIAGAVDPSSLLAVLNLGSESSSKSSQAYSASSDPNANSNSSMSLPAVGVQDTSNLALDVQQMNLQQLQLLQQQYDQQQHRQSSAGAPSTGGNYGLW